MRKHFEDGRDFFRRCLVLARDEWRALSRSRRGRGWALVYTAFILLPLVLYLWFRARIPVSVPLDATVAAWYLTASPWVGLILALTLGHDALTRGEHEGWQEGFASLPVGEFTWLLGRTSGRLTWLLALLAIPYVLGWGLSSLWAQRPLDPVPFVSVFLGGVLLATLLYLPLAILAGCLGNSLLGACVMLFVAFVLTSMASDLVVGWLYGTPFPLPRVLFWEAPAEKAFLLTTALFGQYRWGWRGISTVPAPGLLWPPVASSVEKVFAARAAIAGWCLLFLLGPFLVRLRRRPGRWRPRIKSMPTFARWLSETVDQVKPVAPRGRAAKAASWAGGGLLLLGLLWAAAAAPGCREREAELFMGRYGIGRHTPWPNRFVPAERALVLAMDGSGRLSGGEVLKGSLAGHPGHPVPFAFAPGMELTAVTDGEGRPCPWSRELEYVWVTPPPRREAEVRFAFRGDPRRAPGSLGQMADEDILQILEERSWTVLEPQLKSPALSGVSRWHVRLEGLSWAPEPAEILAPFGRSLGREPCWGLTTLEVTLPRRLVPLPLPGEYRCESRGGTTAVHWRGRSPILPPVCAGRYTVKTRIGSPAVTAAVVSRASDVDGLLDRWAEAWGGRPKDLASEALVLWPADLDDYQSDRWRYKWADFRELTELEPARLFPDGIVRLSLYTTETRPMKVPDPEVAMEIGKRVAVTRARLRYAPLSGLLAEAPPLVRMAAWRLLLALEAWPPPSGSLELAMGVNSPIPKVRAINLSEPPPPNYRWRGDDFQLKLDLACDAVISALGPSAVESALAAMATKPSAPTTFEDFWKVLAGERASELGWLRDTLFVGRGLAKPAIREVTFQEGAAGFRVRVVLGNEGDAFVAVPVRVQAGGEGQTRSVGLEQGGRAELFFDVGAPPDRVVLDPEGSVLREKGAGNTWTRKGGVK